MRELLRTCRIGCLALATMMTMTGAQCDYTPEAGPPSVERSFLAGFTIDAGSGWINPISDPSRTSASWLNADPLGRFLYTGEFNEPDGNNISVHQINPATGALSRVYILPLASQLPTFTVDPTGTFLFVQRDNFLDVYRVESGGLLTATGSFPFPSTRVVADPLGRFVYGIGETITVCRVDSTTGTLTEVSGSPFNVNLNPVGPAAADPSGQYLYVVTATGIVCVRVDSAGALSLTANPPAAALGVMRLLTDPAGNCAYALGHGQIYAYRIDPPSGALTPVTGSPFAAGGVILAMDPLGRFLYTGGETTGVFRIDPPTGALTQVAGSPFIHLTSGAWTMAADGSGNFLYILHHRRVPYW